VAKQHLPPSSSSSRCRSKVTTCQCRHRRECRCHPDTPVQCRHQGSPYVRISSYSHRAGPWVLQPPGVLCSSRRLAASTGAGSTAAPAAGGGAALGSSIGSHSSLRAAGAAAALAAAAGGITTPAAPHPHCKLFAGQRQTKGELRGEGWGASHTLCGASQHVERLPQALGWPPQHLDTPAAAAEVLTDCAENMEPNTYVIVWRGEVAVRRSLPSGGPPATACVPHASPTAAQFCSGTQQEDLNSNGGTAGCAGLRIRVVTRDIGTGLSEPGISHPTRYTTSRAGSCKLLITSPLPAAHLRSGVALRVARPGGASTPRGDSSAYLGGVMRHH
jgi:hypothetical protein